MQKEMYLSDPTAAIGLLKPMPVDELRAQIWAAKEKRRTQLASLPILEKFRIMEQMKEAADPIRAYRRRSGS
jgi:hypothetical protein